MARPMPWPIEPEMGMEMSMMRHGDDLSPGR